MKTKTLLATVAIPMFALVDPHPAAAEHPLNEWVKISPLETAPPSPRLGYEGACVWDSARRKLIRYGGHNQGGGGEQGSEIWIFDPAEASWELRETDTSPPGICCGQQNVFDPSAGLYLRFPAFSGSHGWQWFREIYLNDSSVWCYDPDSDRWANRRPLPSPNPRPLRCASWDTEFGVVVLFGGEGSNEGTWIYDPHANRWTEMRPDPQPPPRSGGNMTYCAAARRHVLFGAQFSNDPHTWTYDLAANRWETLECDPRPPTDQNDAVLTYDPHSERVLALVKVTEGEDEDAVHRLETWTLDVATAAWTRMNPGREPDASGNRARQLHFAPERNLALLENCPRPAPGQQREQQIWTYRIAESDPEPRLSRPRDLRAVTSHAGVTLRWAPPGDDVRYVIRRGRGETPWEVEHGIAGEVDAASGEWRDPTATTTGKIQFYRVHPVGRPSESSLARSQPAIVTDVEASAVAMNRVELRWSAADAADVIGYEVERAAVGVLSNAQLEAIRSQTPPMEQPSVGAIVEIGAFEKLTAAPMEETVFTDETVDLSKPYSLEGDLVYERKFSLEKRALGGRPYRHAVYAYRIRAVNRLGVRSGPSAPAFTIPAAPRFVFAREDGETCRLKWGANGISTALRYRVYRMDGRWRTDPIRRLTPEPVDGKTFTDPEAGTSTRRYHIVAVDALGQEGFPSSPVWHLREWREAYRPFAGEWHQ